MAATVPDYAMFSSEVRLALHAQGRLIELASIGPNEVIPRGSIELDSCDAEIVMDLDGDRFVWPVTLPEGAVPFDAAIRTLPQGEMRRSKSP